MVAGLWVESRDDDHRRPVKRRPNLRALLSCPVTTLPVEWTGGIITPRPIGLREDDPVGGGDWKWEMLDTTTFLAIISTLFGTSFFVSLLTLGAYLMTSAFGVYP
jgi:hypothetical protein